MFFRGISKQRPAKPKYDTTWDPKLFLEHIAEWSNDNESSSKNLTLKLVTLLALVTAQKIQTLSLIDTRDIRKIKDRTEIKIPQRMKTSGPGRIQPNLIVLFFESNRSLCAASTLQCYIQRTEDLRKGQHSLFISLKESCVKVINQTLSRWVKNTLLQSVWIWTFLRLIVRTMRLLERQTGWRSI